jgi:hypothetical protein
MSKPLSATDCISPAIAQTKKQLFAPFRFKRWMRLAIVCMLTGEFSGGGSGGGNFNYPIHHDKGSRSFAALPHMDWGTLLPWIPWIAAGVLLLFLLALAFIYVACVYRFVLFESVLRDQCQLKGSWKRWKVLGGSYFLWTLSLSAISFFGMALLFGVPLLLAWQAGIFHHPGDHLAVLILGGIALFFLFLFFVVVGAVIALFAKDFCVPIMAVDDVGVMEAWRRLLPILGAEKLAFAFYVVMKIVLAIAAAILTGIVAVVVILVLLIPLGIAGVVIFFGAKALGATFDLLTISILVILGGVLLTGLLYLMAIISTPSMVFFQSYVLHFIGSRYPAVGDILFPPSPEPPPLPPMDSTLLPPPLPDPAA